MTIGLSLKEKCYLVAIGGDVPDHRRHALFSMGKLPAQLGHLVTAAGQSLVDRLANSAPPAPPRRRARPKKQLL